MILILFRSHQNLLSVGELVHTCVVLVLHASTAKQHVVTPIPMRSLLLVHVSMGLIAIQSSGWILCVKTLRGRDCVVLGIPVLLGLLKVRKMLYTGGVGK